MTIIKIPFLALYLKLHRNLPIKFLKLSKTTKILSYCEHLLDCEHSTAQGISVKGITSHI